MPYSSKHKDGCRQGSFSGSEDGLVVAVPVVGLVVASLTLVLVVLPVVVVALGGTSATHLTSVLARQANCSP